MMLELKKNGNELVKGKRRRKGGKKVTKLLSLLLCEKMKVNSLIIRGELPSDGLKLGQRFSYLRKLF